MFDNCVVVMYWSFFNYVMFVLILHGIFGRFKYDNHVNIYDLLWAQ